MIRFFAARRGLDVHDAGLSGLQIDRAVQVQPVSPGRRGKRAALSARQPASIGLGLVGRMDGVDVDDRLVRAERVAQVLVRVDELLLGFRVDPVRHGFRLLPVEADAVHQLDQPGAAIVEPEPLQDDLPDLGGRGRQHPRRPGAQFVDLEGRQPSCSTLQVEQDERLDAAFLEFLDPGADGRIAINSARQSRRRTSLGRAAEWRSPGGRRDSPPARPWRSPQGRPDPLH